MEILGGPLFAVAGAGESHGPGITTITFGCPSGIRIERDQIQHFLNRRRPGSNKHGTPRNEADQVVLTSGVFDDQNHDAMLAGPAFSIGGGAEIATYKSGFATGEPIAAFVGSASSKSGHYQQFAGPQGEVRPGHTDLVKHHQSKGFVDYRGGGRSSYRSAISDVVGGSIARAFLAEAFGTRFLSNIVQVGSLKSKRHLADVFDSQDSSATDVDDLEASLAASEIYTIDPEFADAAAKLIIETRKGGDSLGGIVEVIAVNVPPLVGAPLYNSLKLRLMGSLGGLHAARAVEVGSGNDVVTRLGSENNDSIRGDGYKSNHHGGMLGGITTGRPLVARVAFKPTSTITTAQKSVRKDLSEIDYQLDKGRHDPCVAIRAGVALESRMAIELANAVLQHQSGRVHADDFKLFE
ncbi:chorismate synthase [Mariniblastus fucicola]|uniref:Chorismate synthase n=1 Tax=Mariniblastus fucicola TaxID=980251 RepID=A0A5B9P9Y5_9BACT|nr:chorismate synthase [Mariniblastus fucicola]QEG21762.1 Chorismate synthase [Mariniblastus fucicola]